MAYMNLDASEVRSEAMPAANKGASDDNLETFLKEWEVEVKRRIGELPESNAFMRGILRDLAASSGMRKIATSDDEYAAAEALYNSAIDRLGAYPSAEDAISEDLVYIEDSPF